MKNNILAADIGGTNSRFAWFQTEGADHLQLMDMVWLPTKEATSFPRLLEQLRERRFPLLPEQADIVMFAVAGPVEAGVYCAPPYIEWDIDLSPTSWSLQKYLWKSYR